MKKTQHIFTALILVSLALLSTSCATLFTGKQTPIVFVDMPKDLKVYENGVELPIVECQSHAKARGRDVTEIYSAPGVQVKKKTKYHTLTLESNGKKVDVKFKTKVAGGLLFLDIITFPIPAIPVDAATKKWRKIRDSHVDVPAVFSGSIPRSQKNIKENN